MTASGPTVAILLAAGLSTRMGRPKALLEWHGEPLVVYQARQLREAGADQIIVVTGHAAADVETTLAGAGVIIARNARFAEGRATSIQAGAEAVPPGTETIVLLNVDQPRRAATIRRLLEKHRATRRLRGAAVYVTVPAFRGKHGHPAVLDGSLRNELLEVSEEQQGLRAVMTRHAAERTFVEFDTAEVILDLNTPDAYAEAHAGWNDRADA